MRKIITDRGTSLRVLSLFSGIGAHDHGLELVGFTIIGQVEIDEFCFRTLNKHWPNVPKWRDIRTVSGAEIASVCGVPELITGGFPCFVAGTLVLTRDGYRPIETIFVGDEVLTHQGRWRRVTQIMNREAADLWEIRGTGILSTTTTGEHPYFVRQKIQTWNSEARKLDVTFAEPDWVSIRYLHNQFKAAQVLPDENEKDERSPDFWWLIGRYLADGWRVQRKNRKNAGRVVLGIGKTKAEEVRHRILAAGYHATEVEERTVLKFHIVRNDLYRFCAQFGSRAHGKTLPGWVFELSKISAAALLDGYFAGDGHYTNTGHIKASTTSPMLALGIAMLCQRAYGVVAGVRKTRKASTCIIEGRLCSQRDSYEVGVYKTNKSSFIEGKYAWKAIRNVRPVEGKASVYNIAVEEDESYVANGAVVHNCQDISTAGKQSGIDGERSGLWWEMRRVIAELRPGWLLIENVPALRTKGGDRVLASLEELGYACWPLVVGAVHAGAPHRRQRVLIVGKLADADSPRTGVVAPQAGRSFFSFPMPPGPGKYDWEEPRTVFFESAVGASASGDARRLARWRRAALKAIGNANPPQLFYLVGCAIKEVITIKEVEENKENGSMTLSPALFSSKKSDWKTPRNLIKKIESKYGKFTLDAAADKSNRICERWLGPGSPIAEDALSVSWGEGELIWLNYPYGRGQGIKWVKKAYEEAENNQVILLAPVRTGQKWFREYIWKPFKRRECQIIWIPGRLTFEGAEHSASFDSVIVVYRCRQAS